MAELKCLRCGTDMVFSGREQFQMGEESFHSGLLAVMTAESMLMDIYQCPECGKIEFFAPSVRNRTAAAAVPKSNWTCSQCGAYNLARVHACQECGVTRAWSDAQKRKE